jgi:uncharacterized protein YbaA (DUF1428 family)
MMLLPWLLPWPKPLAPAPPAGAFFVAVIGAGKRARPTTDRGRGAQLEKSATPAIRRDRRENRGAFVGSAAIRTSFVCGSEKETDMAYVDGFVIAVPKDKIEAYKDLARKAGAIWKEHGALAYVECIGDDVPYGERTSFPRAVQAKEDEVVIFSWIVYESRAQRDATNAKVMADLRLKHEMSEMPFDGKRLIFGGFEMWLQI